MVFCPLDLLIVPPLVGLLNFPPRPLPPGAMFAMFELNGRCVSGRIQVISPQIQGSSRELQLPRGDRKVSQDWGCAVPVIPYRRELIDRGAQI